VVVGWVGWLGALAVPDGDSSNLVGWCLSGQDSCFAVSCTDRPGFGTPKLSVVPVLVGRCCTSWSLILFPVSVPVPVW
jgi:hypothetical protein